MALKVYVNIGEKLYVTAIFDRRTTGVSFATMTKMTKPEVALLMLIVSMLLYVPVITSNRAPRPRTLLKQCPILGIKVVSGPVLNAADVIQLAGSVTLKLNVACH